MTTSTDYRSEDCSVKHLKLKNLFFDYILFLFIHFTIHNSIVL